MLIRIRDTGQVVGDAEFRRLHASTSFPETLTEEILDSFGADQVFNGTEPQLTGPYEFVFEQGVEEVDGKWYTKKVIGPVFTDVTNSDGVVTTTAEQEAAYRASKDAEKAKAVREIRNKLISECDWTQLDDTPVGNAGKLAWASYRQALRDIPAQPGFPWDVQWPEKP